MSSVLGENFTDYVYNQVNTRQQKLAIKDDSSILAYNGVLPFLRLASAVQISQDVSNQNGFPNDLASKYVLFNGISDSTNTLAEGVYDGQLTFEDSLKKAYGSGYSTEFGLTPLPGLEGATITSLDNGTLRQATVQIRCHTPSQLNLISALYLRIGYTMLLEWGHSAYIDNDGNYVTLNQRSPTIIDRLLFSTDNFYDILDAIEDERRAAAGNYDAFIGRVANYNWNYDSRNGYTVTLYMYSMGDIIESIKINRTGPYINDNTLDSSPPRVADRSILDSEINKWTDVLDKMFRGGFSTPDGTFNRVGVSVPSAFTPNYTVKDCPLAAQLCSLKFHSTSKHEVWFRYVKLGALLQFIQNELLLYTDKSPIVKLIDLDTYDKTLMYTIPEQFSSDPSVCIIPFKTLANVQNTAVATFDAINGDFRVPNNKYVGKIMDIYVNLDFITACLNQSDTSQEKAVYLYKFLLKIVNSINRALGGFNNLEVRYDHDENLIRIVDVTRLPGVVPKNSALTVFDINGVEENTSATFVKDMSLNTDFGKDVQNLLAVSSQRNPNIVGEDGTFFSKVNEGYTDRVLPKKVDSSTKRNTQTGDSAPSVEELSQSQRMIELQKKVYGLEQNPPRRILDDLDTLENLQHDVLRYARGQNVTQLRHEPQGFIPLSLTLSMHGLSGMKIFEEFGITQEFLPAGYREKLSFIVTSITHAIDRSDWTTTIDSFAVGYRDVTQSSVISNNNVPTSPVPGNPNAVRGNDDLRTVIVNAGYSQGTFLHEFAYAIGAKEGWDSTANGGIGTRAFRNNNPGNLVYDSSLLQYDISVTLENNPYGSNRFAHFATAEQGAIALVEGKIKRWARGMMPVTSGNQIQIVSANAGPRYTKGLPPTFSQFIYTYAPPSDGNNTEGYLTSLLARFISLYPQQSKLFERTSLVKEAIDKVP